MPKNRPRPTGHLVRTLLLAAAFCLPAAAAVALEAVYTVRSGDNLTVIGRRFGTDADAIMRANRLASDRLAVGQELRLEADLGRIPRNAVRWGRPLRRPGAVLREFGPYTIDKVIMPQTGVDLACAVGTPVVAAADGVVRHVGAMDGFGIIVLVEHGGGWVTVVAPLDPDSIVVSEGQAVLRGDALGRTGAPEDPTRDPYVHLELRDGKKAVAPDRLHK